MLRRRQKISYLKQYHQPSFSKWLRYTMHAKVLILSFALGFGSIGYALVSSSSAASSVQVVGTGTDGANLSVVYGVQVQQPNGQFYDYGTRTTPYTMANEGYTRLTFVSGPSSYSFKQWETPSGTVTSGTLEYLPKSFSGQTITIRMNAPAPASHPAPAPAPAPTTTRPSPTTAPTQTPPPPADTSDQTPPDPPGQLYGVADEEEGIVQLGWLPANDNVKVSHYVLERSTDQTTWQVSSDKIEDTSYVDSEAAYETKYFYRLKAVDTNNNSSTYVSTELTTPKFKANVTVADGGTFGADDWLSIRVLGESVDEDVQCTVKDDAVSPPSEKGYALFAGPYKISCKSKEGLLLESFNRPATVTIRLDEAVQGQYNDRRFYTGNNGEWQLVETDDKSDRVTFEIKDHMQLAGLGKKKGSSVILRILLVLLALGTAAIAVLSLLFWRYRQRQLARYEDYYRQQHGL